MSREAKENAASANVRFQILRETRNSSPLDKRNGTIVELCSQGFNRAEIAKYLNLTRQRVWQITRDLEITTKPRKLTVSCESCGKSFTKFRTLIVGRKHNYCSRSCVEKVRRDAVPVAVCLACGSTIRRSPSKFAKAERAFCSSKCYYSVRQGRYIPWRQGQRIARKVVSRYFELQSGHVVHHEDSDNRNNSLPNLRVFASQSDHMAYHHGVSEVKPIWDGRNMRES